MSRQAREFETEPFLRHDMDRDNFISSADDKREYVVLNETAKQRAAREKKEQAEKDSRIPGLNPGSEFYFLVFQKMTRVTM